MLVKFHLVVDPKQPMEAYVSRQLRDILGEWYFYQVAKITGSELLSLSKVLKRTREYNISYKLEILKSGLELVDEDRCNKIERKMNRRRGVFSTPYAAELLMAQAKFYTANKGRRLNFSLNNYDRDLK